MIGVGISAEAFGGLLGGARDNAKMWVEKGNLGGRGPVVRKATVVGDTVGVPFRETTGPSMNSLINVTAIVSPVITPLLRGHWHAEATVDRVDRSRWPTLPILLIAMLFRVGGDSGIRGGQFAGATRTVGAIVLPCDGGMTVDPRQRSCAQPSRMPLPFAARSFATLPLAVFSLSASTPSRRRCAGRRRPFSPLNSGPGAQCPRPLPPEVKRRLQPAVCRFASR